MPKFIGFDSESKEYRIDDKAVSENSIKASLLSGSQLETSLTAVLKSENGLAIHVHIQDKSIGRLALLICPESEIVSSNWWE